VVRWQLNSDWISKIKRTKRRKRDEKDEFGSFATCVFGGHGLLPDNGSISYRQQYGHINKGPLGEQSSIIGLLSFF
jgi:hypothetical protein